MNKISILNFQSILNFSRNLVNVLMVDVPLNGYRNSINN